MGDNHKENALFYMKKCIFFMVMLNVWNNFCIFAGEKSRIFYYGRRKEYPVVGLPC